MMNFVLSSFVLTMKLLDQEISVCFIRGGGMRPESPVTSATPLSDDDKARLVANLGAISRICREMFLPSAEHRLQRIYGELSGSTSYQVMHLELAVLKQSIEDDVQFERFYHYPKGRFEPLLRMEADWALAFKSFSSPELKFEITSGLDCYALGHATAAVFHFMRGAEYGLRALARERRVRLPRNKSVEWGTWQEIINQLTAAQKEIGLWRAGPRKDAALSFYSRALSGINAFKDEFRNMVMHVRKKYENEDAAKAMRQVMDFMNDLSARVGDATRGKITKWV